MIKEKKTETSMDVQNNKVKPHNKNQSTEKD